MEARNGTAETVVCVLGTPRSGTSLTAGILNIAGLFIGEEQDLHPPGPGNPTGFWETARAARLNHRIFGVLGVGNNDAPILPAGWERSPSLEAERDEARQLIAEVFGGRPLWGWKDPRNSITLPFWQRLLPPMRYVICVRNPVDMAASAATFAAERGVTPDRQRAFALWECYIANALVNTSGSPRLIVAYEDYFGDWLGAANRLARFAGLDALDGTAGAQEVRDLLDRGHRHHRSPADEVAHDPDLPAGTRLLYRALRDDPGDAELDRLAHRLLEGRARTDLDSARA